MQIEDQVPMIWTSLGNMPLELLEYSPQWNITPDTLQFIEEHRYEGEIVRRSVHVYDQKGFALGAEQTSL